VNSVTAAPAAPAVPPPPAGLAASRPLLEGLDAAALTPIVRRAQRRSVGSLLEQRLLLVRFLLDRADEARRLGRAPAARSGVLVV
jgi:hypothetical protein